MKQHESLNHGARSLWLGLLACACTVTNVGPESTDATDDGTTGPTGEPTSTTTEPTADDTGTTAVDPSGTTGSDATGSDATDTDADSSAGTESSSGDPGMTEVTGAFHKGPMLLGSSVWVSPLAGNGMPTGAVYPTQVLDDTGAFAIDVPGPAARFEANGFFYDELEGSLSTAAITLEGVVPLAGASTEATINVLTHLQADRALVLVDGGMSIPNALNQSAQETTAALLVGASVPPMGPFTELAILGDGSLDDAYLLAVSAVLLQAAHDSGEPPVAALQLLLNTLAADLAMDGALDPERVAQLDDAERNVDVNAVLANLGDWASTVGAPWNPPALAEVIDNDQDGVANAFDNCPFVPNPGQEDGNGDGTGDACQGECPNVVLPGPMGDLPWHQSIAIGMPVDEFTGSCGTPGPERTYLITAPEDGTYTFQVTQISAVFSDIHLYLLDGPCGGGVEHACNDALSGAPLGNSGLELDLLAGEVVTVVADGIANGPGSGPLITIARKGSCPDADLGMMPPPFTVMGSTLDQGTAGGGSCGGLGSNDFAYTWIAPQTSTYRFDTTGSGFDTLVHVRNGSDCNGAELACNTFEPGFGPPGITTAALVAGQAVTIFVDGEDTSAFGGSFTEGDFQLTVTNECPDTDLGNAVPQLVSGTTFGASNQFDPSCTFAATPDEPFLFTAPANGTYVFHTASAGFDAVLYALDGSCGGPELACTQQPAGDLATLQIPMTMGQTITVIVESANPFDPTGTFDLEVTML
ncbi:thrombospondin type 3 repeat-containing protein [Paraliomyxa miuraensis]|uniref:thrombospondin type 3 repeat-containing protein n=1 Tax=Paraliomyxa miuraensis TaxID=376150 RepID=UPI002256775B|nr:thrombospondin type 3 repeat-containing protein [Paraliomyxa miuraensis]MCX4241961.1 thrombospondin type 3 repeat-containing protein [Paraliomyxa miuraensis]